MARADCPLCEGSGWKIVERNAEAAASAGNPEELTLQGAAGEARTVWAVPCDCTSENRTDRALARSRIPERYRHCDFENFETDNDIEQVSREQLESWNRSLTQAKLVVQRFAEEFPASSEHGLLLMGSCGVGKTHLAIAALKQTLLRGHHGLFYDYRELLKEIQDSYNPVNQSTEMGVLEPVLNAEILVLDDVGSSKPSAWALETVGHILNTRYNEKRVTILTTNFLDASAAASLSSASGASRGIGGRMPVVEDTLAERIGTRIRSRLYEMCRTVEISAPDYRKEIRNISRLRG